MNDVASGNLRHLSEIVDDDVTSTVKKTTTFLTIITLKNNVLHPRRIYI